eukprot:10843810-Alexandrium_andersonii.AAC.1
MAVVVGSRECTPAPLEHAIVPSVALATAIPQQCPWFRLHAFSRLLEHERRSVACSGSRRSQRTRTRPNCRSPSAFEL